MESSENDRIRHLLRVPIFRRNDSIIFRLNNTTDCDETVVIVVDSVVVDYSHIRSSSNDN